MNSIQSREKELNRWMLICSFVILLIFVAANAVLNVVPDQSLKSKLPYSIGDWKEMLGADSLDLNELDFILSDKDLVSVNCVEADGDSLYLCVEPQKGKTGYTYLEIYNSDSDICLASVMLQVYENGMIVEMNSGNFSHYRETQLFLTIMLLLFTIILWVGYFKSSKFLGYSYQAVFYSGTGIWMVIVSAFMIYLYAKNYVMSEVYSALAGAASFFANITFPFVIIDAVLLSVSNISLIRHESFRVKNALGIILGGVIVLSFIILCALSSLDISGSEFKVNIILAGIELLYCVYVVLECFLLGSIICGTRAAHNKPAFNKDYIVILGCMIKKDGTLFPLIRGRVDRAIKFYNDQLAATGKKAVFVPSGGQGKNEVISEAEAMKRYLIEQGFAEEQIKIEDKSVNTRQNMMFSKEITGPDANVVFSTTNFHVFRSGIISRQVDFEPEGMGCSTKWYFWPNAYVREVIGMLTYKWKSLLAMFIFIGAFLTMIRFIG